MFKAIMACDPNGGIAKDGTLPWPKSKDDFNLFKRMTIGKIVVMGSKTWYDPIFPKPLKNRMNVVVSSKHVDGADITVDSTKDIVSTIKFIQDYNEKEVFIIGGSQLVTSMLDHIDTFYISEFKNTYDCDTFIPYNEIKDWTLMASYDYDEFTSKIYRRPPN